MTDAELISKLVEALRSAPGVTKPRNSWGHDKGIEDWSVDIEALADWHDGPRSKALTAYEAHQVQAATADDFSERTKILHFLRNGTQGRAKNLNTAGWVYAEAICAGKHLEFWDRYIEDADKSL